MEIMKLDIVQNQLIERYFGATFERHRDLVERLISSLSVETYNSVMRTHSAEEINEIFKACTAKDQLSGKFNDRECKGAFMRLKTVSINTDFV